MYTIPDKTTDPAILKAKRIEWGLSRHAVSQTAGVPAPVVRRHENGEGVQLANVWAIQHAVERLCLEQADCIGTSKGPAVIAARGYLEPTVKLVPATGELSRNER